LTASSWVEVVAAVIERPDGSFLLAQRPVGKVYAGYWEFPGGKVEADESTAAALRREIVEELAIEIELAYPWITRTFVYDHASVRLNFFRVQEWRGEPRGVEGQRFVWQRLGELQVTPMLPANGPVLKALSLPLIYGVTPALSTDEDHFNTDFDRALARGLRMVQLRDKQARTDQLCNIGRRMVDRLACSAGLLLVNSDSGGDGAALARDIGANGIHLSAAELSRVRSRPEVDWLGASCHDAAELLRALEIGADFVVLGPVKETTSHPHAQALGWEGFRSLVKKYPVPVFAIGGLEHADLEIARTHGAHGLAMLRGAWRAA
jgi:8-oxo-dGTP diphosphatase